MQGKEFYANGQRVWQQQGDTLTYFFRSGIVKAQGRWDAGVMQGEWRFYRENGDLWQIGNFRDGQKHGTWVRHDRSGGIEYSETFADGRRQR
ncbi:MAG: hypothetical protein KF887_04585 [Paracoccaceae bacterium]|nr:MAG: hypothetical protein KF887_04585 [Paracoccaceae bacterium]